MELNHIEIITRLKMFEIPSEEEFNKMDCKAIRMQDVCNLILIYIQCFLNYFEQAKSLLNNMQEFNDPNWHERKYNLERKNELFASVVDNLSSLCALSINSKRIFAVIEKVLKADLTAYPNFLSYL